MTNPKPKPKREMAIHKTINDANVIIFDATESAVSDVVEYGEIIYPVDGGEFKRYWIKVSAVYNFDEVVKYIENYG